EVDREVGPGLVLGEVAGVPRVAELARVVEVEAGEGDLAGEPLLQLRAAELDVAPQLVVHGEDVLDELAVTGSELRLDVAELVRVLVGVAPAQCLRAAAVPLAFVVLVA